MNVDLLHVHTDDWMAVLVVPVDLLFPMCVEFFVSGNALIKVVMVVDFFAPFIDGL